MVEHLPNYLEVKGSNLATVAVNERKRQKKFCNKGHYLKNKNSISLPKLKTSHTKTFS